MFFSIAPSNISKALVTRLAAVLLFGVWLTGCDNQPPAPIADPLLAELATAPGPRDEAAIKAFCGDCHLIPSPGDFARDDWEREVAQGFRLYGNSGRDDLVRPDFDATLAYFRNDAPEQFQFTVPESQPDTLFQRRPHKLLRHPPMIGISNLAILEDGTGASPLRFVMTDIWTGKVSLVEASGTEPDGLNGRVIAELSHPSHVHSADLDGDRDVDLVIADLGQFNPDDATKEATLWLLQNEGAGRYERHPIKLGLSRVSSVRSLDHDNDGDLDLVVGDFGMHFTGSIYLLTNESDSKGIPTFNWTVLDDRPGVIDTPIVDLNQDGRPDIVTLVSQHHEVVEVHLNQGEGRFVTEQLYQAANPSSGSSSIEVVDIDGDDDLDILMTNGDTFDDFLAKPYHAIHWLENQGTFPFKHHQIAVMPGVYCARAGDFDLDGDIDIAAVSLLGRDEIEKQPAGVFQGVIWLEQTPDHQFNRHHMIVDQCDAATCNVVDWDADGDLDLVVPPANYESRPSSEIAVYLNQTR